MYCKKCGTEIADNVKFCSNCGTSINDVENEGINKRKIAIIVAICIAVICAVVLGIKAISNNKTDSDVSEQNTAESDSFNQELYEDTTTQTTTTTVSTTKESTTAYPETTKPVSTTQVTTEKVQTNSSGSKELVVGKTYSKIPINIKTKNLKVVGWRGSIADNCDDMEVIAKYDNDYNLETLNIEFKEPSLKDSLFKSMTIAYLNNGEKMITISNYLGVYKNMTEQEYASAMGANAVTNLETMENTYTNMLFMEPLYMFTEYKPEILEGSNGYEYMGTENLATGDAYKFELYCPDTKETMHVWVDVDTGVTAKFAISNDKETKVFLEATEIKA